MLNIAFGQSKYYVDNLSENVKRGNRQKLRRGEWPNQAQFGYLNINKKIEVDKKRAKYVQKAFQLFATGGYGYADIRNFFNQNNILNKSGHELHLDKIKRILTDPFYYGVMKFCGECGGAITAEMHTKNYKRTNRTVEYVYYRLSKKNGECPQK